MAPVATTLFSETTSNASVGAMGRTKSGKPLKVRSYPQFSSLEQERLYRKQHLAAAYRIFAERGFDEGVAGVSMSMNTYIRHTLTLFLSTSQFAILS